MMKHVIAVAVLLTVAIQSFGHCEVPCGIYDDQARVRLMYEHIATIAKSMVEIDKLSKAAPVNYNQLVRWITTKDNHADQFQHIVSQYFMTQRLIPAKPGDKAYQKYITELTLMHELLVNAMKCKQNIDPKIPEAMRETLHQFEHSYFPDHKH
jgi:nickel superoxide dismutase